MDSFTQRPDLPGEIYDIESLIEAASKLSPISSERRDIQRARRARRQREGSVSLQDTDKYLRTGDAERDRQLRDIDRAEGLRSASNLEVAQAVAENTSGMRFRDGVYGDEFSGKALRQQEDDAQRAADAAKDYKNKLEKYEQLKRPGAGDQYYSESDRSAAERAYEATGKSRGYSYGNTYSPEASRIAANEIVKRFNIGPNLPPQLQGQYPTIAQQLTAQPFLAPYAFSMRDMSPDRTPQGLRLPNQLTNEGNTINKVLEIAADPNARNRQLGYSYIDVDRLYKRAFNTAYPLEARDAERVEGRRFAQLNPLLGGISTTSVGNEVLGRTGTTNMNTDLSHLRNIATLGPVKEKNPSRALSFEFVPPYADEVTAQGNRQSTDSATNTPVSHGERFRQENIFDTTKQIPIQAELDRVHAGAIAYLGDSDLLQGNPKLVEILQTGPKNSREVDYLVSSALRHYKKTGKGTLQQFGNGGNGKRQKITITDVNNATYESGLGLLGIKDRFDTLSLALKMTDEAQAVRTLGAGQDPDRSRAAQAWQARDNTILNKTDGMITNYIGGGDTTLEKGGKLKNAFKYVHRDNFDLQPGERTLEGQVATDPGDLKVLEKLESVIQDQLKVVKRGEAVRSTLGTTGLLPGESTARRRLETALQERAYIMQSLSGGPFTQQNRYSNAGLVKRGGKYVGRAIEDPEAAMEWMRQNKPYSFNNNTEEQMRDNVVGIRERQAQTDAGRLSREQEIERNAMLMRTGTPIPREDISSQNTPSGTLYSFSGDVQGAGYGDAVRSVAEQASTPRPSQVQADEDRALSRLIADKKEAAKGRLGYMLGVGIKGNTGSQFRGKRELAGEAYNVLKGLGF